MNISINYQLKYAFRNVSFLLLVTNKFYYLYFQIDIQVLLLKLINF